MTIYRRQPDGTYRAGTPARAAVERSSDVIVSHGVGRSDAPVYLTRAPADAPAAGARDPLALIPVYRAIQLLQTAAMQMPLVVERNGQKLTGSAVPDLIRKPSLELDRSEFVAQCVMSLAMTGELFLRRIRVGGAIVELRVLDPNAVTVTRHEKTRAVTYHVAGEKLTTDDVDYQTLMRRPGQLRGWGPIQAARSELGSQADIRDYASRWFQGSGIPQALLRSDQPLTADEAQGYRDQWNGYDREAGTFRDRDGSNPSGVRVLGKGLDFQPLFLNPSDAQWLDVRQFNVTDVARLFGVPSTLMLVALEGNSMTYSNVEQEWLAFVRFTLMGYLRRIEEALTHLAPLGQTVRFNLDALLRSDTSTRYSSYETAIRSGWMTPDEARAHEDLPPLTPYQRDQVAAANGAQKQEVR